MNEYYRHFKGKSYRVLHIAKHSETLEDMGADQAIRRYSRSRRNNKDK